MQDALMEIKMAKGQKCELEFSMQEDTCKYIE